MQFAAWGLPRAVVERVRCRVDDMWGEGEGGWVPQWAVEARAAEGRGDWLGAALCWGAARFPCLATPPRKQAYSRQLYAYQRAAPTFSARFDRLRLDLGAPGGRVSVRVHVFGRRRRRRRQLIVLCGGVDTWKIELHRLATAIALASGMTVVALDMPGTGETDVPLQPHSDVVLRAAVERLRDLLRPPRVGFMGISFGGHWAVKLAITGDVDASVDLGGPVGAALVDDFTAMPTGMPGILAHAMRLDHLPDQPEAADLQKAFSLREQGLLDRPGGAPVLAVNGQYDQFVPLADTTTFAERPGSEAWVVRGATHCAPEHIRAVLPAATAWLMCQLSDRAPVDRAVAAALRPLARRRLLGGRPAALSVKPSDLQPRRALLQSLSADLFHK